MNTLRRTDFLPGKRRIALDHQLNGRTLTTQVRYSKDLKRYFRGNSFDLRYSSEVHAGDGLLAIPGLALLLPLAWVTGSDVYMPCLDRRYAEAAEQLQQGYREVYPGIVFGTRLLVDELVDSPANPEGSAMMFSGGLDACYTFFANRHLKPHLIQVFGTEFPCSERGFLEMTRSESSEFAAGNGAEITFIETDFRFCVDERALYHSFSRGSGRLRCTLWNGMGFAMGFLGMAAPLSAGRFNHLMLAAWAGWKKGDPKYKAKPIASAPDMDERTAWANLRTEHHGCLHRYEKIREMKDWLKGRQLRVCWRFDDPSQAGGMMNCSRCEKCARTIVGLAIAGVDPTQCGFTIDQESISYARALIEKRQLDDDYLALWWEPMHKAIPAEIEADHPCMREFLEWFRDFDLMTGQVPKPPRFSIDSLYSRCPYPLALAIRSAVFSVLGEPHWMNRVESLPPETD